MQNYATLNTPDYHQLRYDILVNVEESGDPKELPYVDSVGIPTIGIGFNLRGPDVRREVLQAYDFEFGNPSDRAYATEIEAIANQTWPNDQAGVQALQDDLNDVMDRRANDPAIPAGQRDTFEFANEAEIRGVFDRIIRDYETTVDNWSPDIPDSNERAALTSLAYNNPALLGQGLRSAIENDNRAEAWYEIRHNSNGGASASDGIAKRRYYESEVFGVNDDTMMNGTLQEQSAQALATYQTYTNHRDGILSYENQYDHMVARANNDYGLTGTTHEVSSLEESLMPAYDRLLIDHDPGITPAIDIDYRDIQVRDDQANQVTGTQRNNHQLNQGNEQNDLMITGAGDDELSGGEESDILVGGEGSDRYHFSGNFGHDVVVDDDGDIIIDNETLSGTALYQASDGYYLLTTAQGNDYRIEQQGNDLVISRDSDGDQPDNSLTLKEAAPGNATDTSFGIQLDYVPTARVTDPEVDYLLTKYDLADKQPDEPQVINTDIKTELG